MEILTYDSGNESIHIDDPEMVSFLSGIYRETRYLKNARDEDLAARVEGLVAVLVSFNREGEPQLRVGNGREAIALIELLEEFKLRNSKIEQLLEACLRRYEGLSLKRDIDCIETQLQHFRGKKCLFKFTKAKYVDAILNGEVRFRRASSYNNAGLSIGIRDDELNIDHSLSGLRITTEDGAAIPIKDNRITCRAAGDYYVSCFSSDFRLQFFPLFGCDSCVLIADAEKYAAAVIEQYEQKFPECLISFGSVEYVDRYRQLKTKRPIEYRKCSDYAYEKEFRFVSFPKNGSDSFEPVRNVNVDARNFEYCTIRIAADQSP